MSKIKSPISVLRLSFNLFKRENSQIFYPYIIIVFINLLLLEILYFLPRYPLSIFFAPIINHIWGEEYLHYPMNLLLLPKLFYYTQVVVFILFSSFLTVLAVDMVATINNEKPVNFRTSLKKSFPGYIYIVLYSLLSLLLFKLFDGAYSMLMHRALKIHSTAGTFFLLKKSIFYGAPYVQCLYGILIAALIIYTPILIILEKKKFLAALIGNFKLLFGSFWLTFSLVLIPTLFYIPILLIRENFGVLADMTSPEIQVLIIILTILVTTGINIFIVTSATTYYLYKKENL